MRVIIVNHCHPECPHVCGTRAREFAGALARRGHAVVLLTGTLRREDPPLPQADLSSALSRHDWGRPFLLACLPRPSPMLEAARAGRLPVPLRKAVTAACYTLHGGVFSDWRAGSRPYWDALARDFKPEIVWGIFGNTDAWAIAQGIARLAGCPWVRDFKDQWTRFIPGPLRAYLARRFGDAAGITALSEANAADPRAWFAGDATIVYSGVAADCLAPRPAPTLPERPFRLVLAGAVYAPQMLTVIGEGVRRFADTAGPDAIQLAYLGSDGEAVRRAIPPVPGRVSVTIRGQLPFAEYWRTIAEAHANLYIRMPSDGWWHHKIVELLATGRSVLCCPGEIEEARRLAAEAGGTIHACPTPEALAAILGDIQQGRVPLAAAATGRLAGLTWDAQAGRLLQAFERVR